MEAVGFPDAGFMTQLSRYAQIVKLDLRNVRIVQDNGFRLVESADGALAAVAGPFDTHVFIEAEVPVEAAQGLVRIGERTCFLHAAMRGSYPSNVAVHLNGSRLSIP